MLFSSYEILLIKRFLFSKKTDGFISIFSWFSIIGITIGVAAIIIVMAVMNGFREELTSRLLGINGHLNIYSNTGQITKEEVNIIKSDFSDNQLIPLIQTQALVISNEFSKGVFLRGYDNEHLDDLHFLKQNIVEGKLFGNNINDIVIGYILANKFGLSVGDQIKIGRRGGYNGVVTVFGKEGHSAWPNRTKNPVSALIKMLTNIDKKNLDKGTKHFQPSIISITSIDVGNEALNVIPAKAIGCFNIRFNPKHTTKSLTRWIKKEFNKIGFKYKLNLYVSGNAFLTKPGKFSELIKRCVKKITKKNPKYATDGGTSDARFINAEGINVVEFGLVGKTMHTNSEKVSLKDLKNLTKIYKLILEEYFK